MRDGVIHGVGFEEVEATRMKRGDLLDQVAGEHGVTLHGPDLGAGFKQGARERAEAGPDLDHALTRGDLGELDGLSHDVAIDKKVLAEAVLGMHAQLGESFAGFGESERHGRCAE